MLPRLLWQVSACSPCKLPNCAEAWATNVPWCSCPPTGHWGYGGTFPGESHSLPPTHCISKASELRDRGAEGPSCEKGNFTAPHRKTTPVQAPGERITFDIPLLWHGMNIKHLGLHLPPTLTTPRWTEVPGSGMVSLWNVSRSSLLWVSCNEKENKPGALSRHCCHQVNSKAEGQGRPEGWANTLHL